MSVAGRRLGSGRGFADRAQVGAPSTGAARGRPLRALRSRRAELRAGICAELLHRRGTVRRRGRGGRWSSRRRRRRRARSGREADPVADDAVGIPLAVDPLVAGAGDLQDDRVEIDLLEDVLGDERVLAITRHSSSSSGPGLCRMRSGMPIFPMSWRSAPISIASSCAPSSRGVRERDGDVGDALGVAAGVVVLRLHAARERADGLDQLLAHLLDQPCALDRGRELREDRVRSRSQRRRRRPASAEVEPSDPRTAGVGVPRSRRRARSRPGAGEPCQRLLRVAGQCGAVVRARGVRRRTGTAPAGRRSAPRAWRSPPGALRWRPAPPPRLVCGRRTDGWRTSSSPAAA